jgi:Lipopolysaccharide biosynthesis proteins, LPS:glycosyltransferases
MLTSLFENNSTAKFVIHILIESLKEDNIYKIKDLINNKYKQEVVFHKVDSNLTKDCYIPANSGWTLATYYRLFVGEILDKEIEKIIYLDCDLVIVGNIIELWNIDIDQYAVGCIEDMWSGKANNYSRLNYDPKYSYFNAGVLLMNLKYFREHKLQDKAIKYVRRMGNKLIFCDQDILNALIHDQKQLIHLRYNMQDGFYRRRKQIRTASIPTLLEEIKHPVIIHYTGSKKPWQYKSQHPMKYQYEKYLDLTEWKGERPHMPFNYKMILTINKILIKLGVLKPKYDKIN